MFNNVSDFKQSQTKPKGRQSNFNAGYDSICTPNRGINLDSSVTSDGVSENANIKVEKPMKLKVSKKPKVTNYELDQSPKIDLILKEIRQLNHKITRMSKNRTPK